MKFEQVLQARQFISPYVFQTPLIFSKPLSLLTGKNVWLKLETQQPTGSFKVRPAFNGILTDLDRAREHGVLTTSSGNFAQGVAYAAKLLKIRATIVMTSDTAPFKISRTRELGAEIVLCGTRFESRFEVLERLEKERKGIVVLHGFNSEETIAGNGTIGLELCEQFQQNSIEEFAVYSPASGGGLISGIALALSSLCPHAQVFGFQPEAGGAIVHSLREGSRVNVGKVNTIADALVASIPGERTFEMIKQYISGFELVTEEQIKTSVKLLFNEQKLVVEPGGAVSVAGLLSGKLKTNYSDVVCILSGGNIEAQALAESVA